MWPSVWRLSCRCWWCCCIGWGAVSLAALKTARPYVVVAAFVVAGIVTPPDVISQFLLAVPLIALYEAGLLMCRLFKPNADAAETTEADEAT